MDKFIVQFIKETMKDFSKLKQAFSELKNLDNILTQISKKSDLTTSQLEELGNSAYDTASKYGKSAESYLRSVAEMYHAGFSNAKEMSELSILAQASGDMAANIADDYFIATNAAYDLKGNVEELTAILDGQNYIADHASVRMNDMAQATGEAASVAAQCGVKIEELSSLIAIASAKTRESGVETGAALKTLLINLQDITNKPIREAFDEAGISMTEFVNGSEKLKNPIQLLHELSDTFVSLNENSTVRANILNQIGGESHSNTLAAILSDWSGYEEVLNLYASGSGSAMAKVEKSTDNWTDSVEKLNNAWLEFVDSLTNQDAIIRSIHSITGLLNGFTNLTDKIGAFSSLSTIGAGIAGAKGLGLT